MKRLLLAILALSVSATMLPMQCLKKCFNCTRTPAPASPQVSAVMPVGQGVGPAVGFQQRGVQAMSMLNLVAPQLPQMPTPQDLLPGIPGEMALPTVTAAPTSGSDLIQPLPRSNKQRNTNILMGERAQERRILQPDSRLAQIARDRELHAPTIVRIGKIGAGANVTINLGHYSRSSSASSNRKSDSDGKLSPESSPSSKRERKAEKKRKHSPTMLGAASPEDLEDVGQELTSSAGRPGPATKAQPQGAVSILAFMQAGQAGKKEEAYRTA